MDFNNTNSAADNDMEDGTGTNASLAHLEPSQRPLFSTSPTELLESLGPLGVVQIDAICMHPVMALPRHMWPGRQPPGPATIPIRMEVTPLVPGQPQGTVGRIEQAPTGQGRGFPMTEKEKATPGASGGPHCSYAPQPSPAPKSPGDCSKEGSRKRKHTDD